MADAPLQPLPGDDDPFAAATRRINFEAARLREECTKRVQAAEARVQAAEAEVLRLASRLEAAWDEIRSLRAELGHFSVYAGEAIRLTHARLSDDFLNKPESADAD